MDKNSSVYKMMVLGIMCAVFGLLLSTVNKITAPIIAENALATVKASLEQIYPGADFEDVTDKYIANDETGLIDGIYEAKDKGYIFTLHGTGYNSNGFTFMVGFDNDGKVSGYTALEENETGGIGKRAFEEDYTNTILSLTSSDPIPLLTGATLTSTAVQKGIDAAKAVFNEVQGISYDPNAVAALPTLGEMDYTANEAACTEQGDGVYACSAKGYVAQNEGGDANEALITIRDGKVVSVEMTAVKDTPGMSDSAVTEAALAAYAGADLDSVIETGATSSFTDGSIKAMVQAALKAAAGN
ncbi:MAG: FMN-binding protein [Solobacterium sp.]|nr:FMN-binding protein [Solobacterium sp.]